MEEEERTSIAESQSPDCRPSGRQFVMQGRHSWDLPTPVSIADGEVGWNSAMIVDRRTTLEDWTPEVIAIHTMIQVEDHTICRQV
jgi:hypothetical protein